MDPILRRSSFYYMTTFVIFNGILGRFLGRDPWPAFEAIPLLMPVYLMSAVLFSEAGESYAFLRTLPVRDGRIVGTKFALIGLSTTLYWIGMMTIALGRMDEGVSSPSTLVYVTIVCAGGLLLASGLQLAIWSFGRAKVVGPAVVIGGLNLVLVIVHTASLRRTPDWPVFAHTWPIDWMGRMPWLSVPALTALAAIAAVWLMRVGVRVKEHSEAAL
ncbi:MAG: hypothetical protein AB1806_17720 [Acidobacteriota bacterium]